MAAEQQHWGDGDDDEDEEASDDSWDSDQDSEAEIAELMQLDMSGEASTLGKKEYLAKCIELKIVPVAMFIAKLECEHINLRHYGVGIKGAKSLAEALKVNTRIKSLNLGDNWFADEGTQAVAEALKVNATLTSLNLSDNKIGLVGVRALCQGIKANSVLAELSLKGNGLDDRAAEPLAEVLRKSSSITRVDLSHNAFSEEAGRHFGAMLSHHSHLLDVDLKWNSLRAKGGAAIAEALKSNSVLNKLDLGWNGLGDEGAKAVAEMLTANTALTHLDLSHNRVNLQGAIDLASGIKSNVALLNVELNFNPMGVKGMEHDTSGLQHIVDALRENHNLESVGLSNVQSGGSYKRGAAARFDPKNPDGHYVLDLSQPWDHFLAETLYERMVNETGESWINHSLDAKQLELPQDSSTAWEMPGKGVLEFDYVTWKRGLEAVFQLDLSNPCDLFLGEQILSRTAEADTSRECLRECKLNGLPFEAGDELPAKGKLHLVYCSTQPQDELVFSVSLDLSRPDDKVMALRLWERALTAASDSWKSAKLDGAAVTLTTWQYPEVPAAGTFELDYSVALATKPTDRGLYFSAPMAAARFKQLHEVLSCEALSDFDKVNLIKHTAASNYLTSQQVKQLIESVSYRKGKLEVAVFLHSRTVDQANFGLVVQALPSEADRQAVLEQTQAEKGRRRRRE